MKKINIEKYLYPNILEQSWSLYKEDIKNYIELNSYEFLLGQKRDNCGIVAADFSLFMEKRGIDFQRVRGDFVTDIGVYTKLDFYKEDLEVMKSMGLNPKLLDDRMKFVEEFNLYERQKRIPHYWNINQDGLIVDLSAYSQFVKTGLAKNVDFSRYEPEPVKNEKKLKF